MIITSTSTVLVLTPRLYLKDAHENNQVIIEYFDQVHKKLFTHS
jgi:hypothetical protein